MSTKQNNDKCGEFFGRTCELADARMMGHSEEAIAVAFDILQEGGYEAFRIKLGLDQMPVLPIERIFRLNWRPFTEADYACCVLHGFDHSGDEPCIAVGPEGVWIRFFVTGRWTAGLLVVRCYDADGTVLHQMEANLW